MFRFRPRGTPRHPLTTDVAAECASFLAGEYLDCLIDRDQEVPAWVWVNLAAHASPDRLAELATTTDIVPGQRADHGAWRSVVRSIATDVLRAHGSSAMAIEEIQALALVPIEFALMANPVGPRTTLRLVEHALGRTTR